MERLEVSIPIQCPRCGTPTLADFPVAVVVMALTSWKQMRLYSACHEGAWDATPSELEAIRVHLGDVWIEARRISLMAKTRVFPILLHGKRSVPSEG
jgi:hypothetical protein